MMKKRMTLILVLLLSINMVTACSTPSKDRNPTESEYTEKMDIKAYMPYFVNFFHEPYKMGDDISKINLVHLSLRFCLDVQDEFEFIQINKEQQELKVTGEGLKTIAKGLFGENVDISSYHDFLYNSTDVYAKELDTYFCNYAKGYWEGDFYYVKEDVPLEITESEATLTVTASTYYAPTLGVMENIRKMEYTFKKVIYEGYWFWQISEINVV